MEKRIFMLCQYPAQGFGGKSGQWYLLDVWGNRYDIKDEYDKVLSEMNKVVCLTDNIHNLGTFCERTLDGLIQAVEINTGSKIERW